MQFIYTCPRAVHIVSQTPSVNPSLRNLFKTTFKSKFVDEKENKTKPLDYCIRGAWKTVKANAKEQKSVEQVQRV